MAKQNSTERLECWLEALRSLNDSKSELDEFETEMSTLVETTLGKLHKEIEFRLKKLESKTDCDWTGFLDDFCVYDWAPGDFQDSIREWLLNEIKSEAQKVS